ncbi:MAG: HlyC/CorC family transporter [Acidobacteria bacterium]|nr:HlyC/CorC family transporter [Acidobacteriota bacterium]
MLTSLLIVAAMVAVTALYVAAEFAAVSVRRSRVRQLAEDGHATAKRLLPILEDATGLDRYIAACQVGITLSSLVLGAYGQIAFGPALSNLLQARAGLEPIAAASTAAGTILLVLTVGTMVVGELAPKSLALQFPTEMALYTYWPMRWSLWLLGPFIWFLNGSGTLILRMLGSGHGTHRHVHSPEEIELLLAESHDGGLLEPDELRRLQRALRFSLRSAQQMMTARDRMQAIDASMPVEDVLAMALESSQAHVPVYRGTIDTVVGFLNTKRLLVRHVEGRPVTSLRELIQPAVTVDAHMTGDRLVAELRKRRAHQAIVRDAQGRVVGMVTLDDILSSLLGPTPDEFTRSTLRMKAPRATRARP